MKKYLLLVLAAGAASASYISFQIFGAVDLPANIEVQIQSGDTLKDIGRRLKEQGIVKDDFWFRAYAYLKGKQADFVAGRFVLPQKVSVRELLGLLTSGQARPVRTVKIIEGWSTRDIIAYLAKEGWYQGQDLKKLDGREGYLFPDTYYVFADASIDDLIKKISENFTRRLDQELRAEIKKQGKDLEEILKVASIIEAEVPHQADRPIVSDIIWKRLKIGMAIQSDATLNYATGGKRAALTAAELKIDSPYNTYKYRSLPPTAIGNPGLAAIRAAVFPAKTDYWYWLSTPAGETIFSRNLDEHNRAKVKYLK